MRDWVNEWRQEGALYLWRYAEAKRGWRGWQFAADPLGCRSVRNLIDRMSGGDACHRTLSLAPITDAVLREPGYNRPCADRFDKLRLVYEPNFAELNLTAEDSGLILTLGQTRLRKLSAAFADVERGGGDFGIRPSVNHKTDPWLFWWAPNSGAD